MTETPCRYTLADLDAARAVRAAVETRWENYSGNNPEKYRSRRQEALDRVRGIEAELKRCGVIPYTDAEILTRALDRLYPDAPSRSIVEHEGRHYQIRYIPNGHSLAGNVKGGWSHTWHELTAEKVKAEKAKQARKRKEK